MSDIDKSKEKLVQESKSAFDTVYQYSNTPYPAWVFASMLAATPLISSAKVADRRWIKFGGADKPVKFTKIGPSNLSVGVFGAAAALGGYMIYDGDAVNGAGFTMAWLALYLIVNAKNSMLGISRGRVVPVALSTAALINATIYGRKFIWQ